MEISIGLFVGLIIFGILVAIYDWVRLGMPFGRRKTHKRKPRHQKSKNLDTSKETDQR